MKLIKQNKNTLLILAVSFALSFFLYGNGINGELVADEKLVILRNPLVQDGPENLDDIFLNPYYYNQPHAGLYRPLTIATYALNNFFSARPFGFHLINILLNALNAFLVFLAVSRISDRRTAFLSLILFSFLPIHTEAVSSIVGRAELLSFLFSLASLLLVFNKRYAWSSAALLLGLLSKETAVGFFPVFLYLWRFKEQKTLKQIFHNSLFFVPAVVVYAVLRYIALGKYFIGFDHLFAYNPLRFSSFFQSLWTSLKVFYLYLLKTFIPHQLSSDYSFNQIPIIKNPYNYEIFFAMFVLAVLIWLTVKKRNNIYGLSALIFLSTYVLISNWFVKIGTIMGERLMYAPSLGIVVIIAVLLNRLMLKRGTIEKATCAILVIVFMVYGYIIIDRNKDWQNESSLIRSGYAASPKSVVSLTNMGFLAFNEKNYEEASKWTSKALEALPDHVPALYLYGHASKKRGDLRSAETAWENIIKLNTGHVEAHLSLGILYYEQGLLNKAELILEKGFQLEQTWGKAFPLAIVKISLDKYDESIELIIDNFGLNPEKRELKFALGLAYLKKGDIEKADFYLKSVKDQSENIENYFKKILNQKVFKIEEY